jgi:rhamnogalacturonan endolyase
MAPIVRPLFGCILSFSVFSAAFLNATESSVELIIQNDRLFASVNKSTGAIGHLSLDGQDLLGTLNFETPTPGGATGSGNSGIGPYVILRCKTEFETVTNRHYVL